MYLNNRLALPVNSSPAMVFPQQNFKAPIDSLRYERLHNPDRTNVSSCGRDCVTRMNRPVEDKAAGAFKNIWQSPHDSPFLIMSPVKTRGVTVNFINYSEAGFDRSQQIEHFRATRWQMGSLPRTPWGLRGQATAGGKVNRQWGPWFGSHGIDQGPAPLTRWFTYSIYTGRIGLHWCLWG